MHAACMGLSCLVQVAASTQRAMSIGLCAALGHYQLRLTPYTRKMIRGGVLIHAS